MTSDRILQLSAAVQAMPDGPSRQRFSALLAELSDAEGVPVPVPAPSAADHAQPAAGHDADPVAADACDHAADPQVDLVVDPEASAPEPSLLDGPLPDGPLLDGPLLDVVPRPAVAELVEQPVAVPKKRRWRRSS